MKHLFLRTCIALVFTTTSISLAPPVMAASLTHTCYNATECTKSFSSDVDTHTMDPKCNETSPVSYDWSLTVNGVNIKGTKSCPLPSPPTNVTATCHTPGTSVTISWAAGSGATVYFPRVGIPSGSSCPSGWTLWTDGTTCYQNDLTSTSVTFATNPNQAYSSWIHSGDPRVNWTEYGSVNFTCLAPPTVNIYFSLLEKVKLFIFDTLFDKVFAGDK